MSILGFSIVENPKMTFIFILGYLNPRKGALRGRVGCILGVLSPILPKIMCFVNSGVLYSGKSKNDLHFILRYPNPRKGALRGGGQGG